MNCLYSSTTLTVSESFPQWWAYLTQGFLQLENSFWQGKELILLENKGEDGLRREILLESGESVVEEIEFNWKTKEIHLHLKEHPELSGFMVQRLLPFKRPNGEWAIDLMLSCDFCGEELRSKEYWEQELQKWAQELRRKKFPVKKAA